MAKHPLPTIEQLRQVLAYDPETGRLTWLPRDASLFADGKRGRHMMAKVWNATWAGKPALTHTSRSGHLRGAVFHVGLQAHRVAWAIFYGRWPDGEIDHINGNPADNRIANLRDCSRTINGQNLRMKRTNTSGYVGVTRDHALNKWRAQATVNGQHFYIGVYPDLEDAARARDDFHRQHGGPGCVFNFPKEGEPEVRR